ncbi:hypothetical protein DY037_05585 [Apilactobacillus micheneri]|uniref:hypothetical protein n=1 Tax=Apilactobacillus micheneri TaxID=1899430 RepID=UPI0011283088|nr:hypothetical protein [Apilactobacillus micheneri]TPR49253.1 hypothetical protein DY037_05585 [Apilactobacillus micheneri]
MKNTISNNLVLFKRIIENINPSAYPEDKLFKIVNYFDSNNSSLDVLGILKEHNIIITDNALWKHLNFVLLNNQVDFQTNEKEFSLYNQFTKNNRLFSLNRYYDDYINLPMDENDYQKAILTLKEVL